MLDALANIGIETPRRDDVDVAIENTLELRLKPRQVEKRESGIESGLDEHIKVR